jgi:hypothetical protein
MKKIIFKTAMFITLMGTACSTQTNSPLIIDGKLIVPAGQTLIIPAGGILFSNGVMIGGGR